MTDKLDKYGIKSLYIEMLPLIEDFVDISFVYNLEDIYRALSKLLICDRESIHLANPMYRQEVKYAELEPLSIPYMDLLTVYDSIHKIKIKHNETTVNLTAGLFYEILFKLAITFCDGGSRMLHYIFDNYVKYHQLTLDMLVLVIEQNRTDIMGMLIKQYGKDLILDNATDLALAAIRVNAINAYIYINLLAHGKINYKVLVNALINFEVSNYAYEIEPDNNINFITKRIISDAVSFDDRTYVKL